MKKPNKRLVVVEIVLPFHIYDWEDVGDLVVLQEDFANLHIKDGRARFVKYYNGDDEEE